MQVLWPDTNTLHVTAWDHRANWDYSRMKAHVPSCAAHIQSLIAQRRPVTQAYCWIHVAVTAAESLMQDPITFFSLVVHYVKCWHCEILVVIGIINDQLFVGMKPVWRDKVRNVIYRMASSQRQRETMPTSAVDVGKEHKSQWDLSRDGEGNIKLG